MLEDPVDSDIMTILPSAANASEIHLTVGDRVVVSNAKSLSICLWKWLAHLNRIVYFLQVPNLPTIYIKYIGRDTEI